MNQARILAIGDNVVDKYLSRGKMYPGGQCLNTCVYSKMNGGEPAFMGKFGDDAVAAYNCGLLTRLGIDFSRSRHFHGENGYARVTLKDGDRVFLGSNKGGIAKEHPWNFTEEDLEYIRGFQVIYTNTNSYIYDDLPLLAATGVPVAFDFTNAWDDALFARVCPYVSVALLSCAHLTDDEREREMKKAADLGVRLVVGTVGENGSFALYGGEMIYMTAFKAAKVLDTMGAGDSYFATLLTSLLKEGGALFGAEQSVMISRIRKAMEAGARFSAEVCGLEGAFGYGTEIVD